jgi:hypothetical protein
MGAVLPNIVMIITRGTGKIKHVTYRFEIGKVYKILVGKSLSKKPL